MQGIWNGATPESEEAFTRALSNELYALRQRVAALEQREREREEEECVRRDAKEPVCPECSGAKIAFGDPFGPEPSKPCPACGGTGRKGRKR